jgi:hypothetical protein
MFPLLDPDELLNPDPQALSARAPVMARVPAASQRLRLCILFSLMNMPAAEGACAAFRLDRQKRDFST